MKVEQFIIDTHPEHAALLSMLPNGFELSHNVLRIRFEIRSDFDGMTLAHSTLIPVLAFGKAGWLRLSETIMPIESAKIDMNIDENGAKTVLFNLEGIEASFTDLETIATSETLEENQGEFMINGTSAHFTPREIILNHPTACNATLKLTDMPNGDIVQAVKIAFDRYPRCGCCGPQEVDYPLSED